MDPRTAPVVRRKLWHGIELRALTVNRAGKAMRQAGSTATL